MAHTSAAAVADANMPVVSNVKAQFVIRDPLERMRLVLNGDDEQSNFCLTVRKYSNFSVVRLAGERYVYTIWKKKGDQKLIHVNVTAVPNFELLDDAISVFCLYACYPRSSIVEDSVLVDSSTFSGRLPAAATEAPVNLVALMRKVNGLQESGVVAIIIPQVRRVLLVKFTQQQDGGVGGRVTKQGTLSIQKSGKYNILGAKSEEQARKLCRWMLENLRGEE